MKKYLSHYAEIQASLFTGFDHSYDNVLCIPAFAEEQVFLHRLMAIQTNESVLVILIVNCHRNVNADQRLQTQALSDYLRQQCPHKNAYADNICLLEMSRNIDVLLIDHCRTGYFLPEKSGVGLARKIACDIACQLIKLGKIQSSWIHSTDADALLPEDYFEASKALNIKSDSAAIYPFLHTPHPDRTMQRAQQLYDLSMDYYVKGLKWADSPWAYHTIGSTLLINAEHYALARGFPKRPAGEDFYLLNKLAKLGTIQLLKTSPLSLTSRLSDRVPFGTGPAVTKILAMEDPLHQYAYYHPHCFLYLKCWYAVARDLWIEQKEHNQLISVDLLTHQIKNNEIFEQIDSKILLNCLQALGVNKALEHGFNNSNSEQVFNRHMENWFDSFMTLKFIHWLRDNHFPSLPIHVLVTDVSVKRLPFVSCLADYAQAPPA